MDPVNETHVGWPGLGVADVAAADDTAPAFPAAARRRRPAGCQRDCRRSPAGTFRVADGAATPRMLPQTDSSGSSFSRVSRPSRPVQRRCPGRTARCRRWSRLNRPAPEIA
ncbi:DUF6207 family protein [Streptomyces sp. NBC_00659]